MTNHVEDLINWVNTGGGRFNGKPDTYHMTLVEEIERLWALRARLSVNVVRS